jgi:hypothetical protein
MLSHDLDPKRRYGPCLRFPTRPELKRNADLAGLSAANAAAALSRTFVVNGSPTQTAMVEGVEEVVSLRP